ncbi:uncharacterized protein EAF01_000710 [Botrytis porri]|uniref:Uncharacterized protein n=1 Tax=Botrytis porri TaxID=87229 RepID=A0A4Z1L459_9HELO|nr:uncharacterized protein EAF01_000710 [Botrytis porri]KAF7914304.1 hypothetical protein EAF01_000710 [Botrytis porri]TGO91610.1 hypothetical protein BPOR_0023g00350 [Botrytis porri]
MGYFNQYIGNDAYYIYKGKPLVSTFEGAGDADARRQIKAQTGIVFILDWSSLGAQAALKLDVADGLFSWAAWPWGNTDMNTYVDASYNRFLDAKPYMMPVSPWFYTNLPQFHKNWLWRGDDLWYDRWEEVIFGNLISLKSYHGMTTENLIMLDLLMKQPWVQCALPLTI